MNMLSKFKLNLQFFATEGAGASSGGTKVPAKETAMIKKHKGILEKVTAKQAYSAPALISNDAIFMQGRAFTIMKGDTTPLQDYDRTQANSLTNIAIEENEYFLDQEKYWGRFVDALDKRDTEGNIDVNYVVAKQGAEVVAPYLDNLRFATLVKNTNKHLTLAANKKEAAYEALLDVNVELDEIGASDKRILFCSPSFYKGIKQFVVALPQGDNKQLVLSKGIQGELDGFLIVKVPSKYLQKVEAIAVVGEVLASPIQVDNTRVLDNIQGRFGEAVEQLLYTGAFVPEHLQKFIYTIGGTAPTVAKDGKDIHKDKKATAKASTNNA